MIGDLFFVCPRCGCFHCVKSVRGGAKCARCQVEFVRQGDLVKVGGTVRPAWEWFDQAVASLDALPTQEDDQELGLAPGESVIAESEWGRARRSVPGPLFEGFGGVRANVEELAEAGECRLLLTNRRLFVDTHDGKREVPLEELVCVTTDARDFVFRQRGERAVHVEFPGQSPLFWELVTQRAIARFWAERGREVVEFQPVVRFRDREKRVRRSSPLVRPEATPRRPRGSFWNELLYSAIRAVARRLFRLYFGLELRGAENLPVEGPFFLIANHEGYLDSFFALAALPVKIGFLAKNTEFKSGLNRWVMRVFRSIPVHRHRPDPTALLNMVRLLRRGAPVAAFPEGERTWDGRRLKPKRTLVKLLMRAGVPIVPCRISGSFRTMPRWDHSVQRRKVVIRVGEPFRIPEDITSIDEAIDFVGRKLDALAESLDSPDGGKEE